MSGTGRHFPLTFLDAAGCWTPPYLSPPLSLLLSHRLCGFLQSGVSSKTISNQYFPFVNSCFLVFFPKNWNKLILAVNTLKLHKFIPFIHWKFFDPNYDFFSPTSTALTVEVERDLYREVKWSGWSYIFATSFLCCRNIWDYLGCTFFFFFAKGNSLHYRPPPSAGVSIMIVSRYDYIIVT